MAEEQEQTPEQQDLGPIPFPRKNPDGTANKDYSAEWYRRNKERIAERKRNASPEERAKRSAYDHNYQQEYYAKNKDRIGNRVKEYRAVDPERWKEYQAQWYQDNREAIDAKRLELYHNKYKPEEQARLQQSEMIGPTEAAAMLGVSLRTCREWVTRGHIPSTKSPTGRRLIARVDIEHLQKVKATTEKGKSLMQIKTTPSGYIAPPGFDLITTYDELDNYTKAFAEGLFSFLLLVGSPGSGKSQQMKSSLTGKAVKWIDANASNLGLYCAVYEANNKPVVLDDVNHFLTNKQAVSLLKAFTQTDAKRSVSWESSTSYLDEREVPRDYITTSPFCMIANLWNSKDADYAAIQDRGVCVAFFPTAETLHQRVIDLDWVGDDAIVEFIGGKLDVIPRPSMRDYFLAKSLKRAKMDWQAKLLAKWDADSGEA